MTAETQARSLQLDLRYKEKWDPTEEDQIQNKEMWGRATVGHIRKNEGEFQPYKLMKMLDKLLRNT